MPHAKPKALHFGAGNIGRGFIGALLCKSGYHVVFSDVDKDLVAEMNKRNSYTIRILDNGRHTESVSGISAALPWSDDIICDLADPDTRIVTTAVGATVLQEIAPTIAKGLIARHQADAGPLNVIACENMVRQTELLSKYVHDHLPPDESAWVDRNIGFANCSVDRIVPPGEDDNDNPLDVYVEGFREWVVDQTALRAKIEPEVLGMQLTEDLWGYVERKLFSLNCGHAIIAYLGFLKGYRTIDRAVRDDEIRRITHAALHEGGAALVRKHGFHPSEHEEYITRIMDRYLNPNLRDDVFRVGRQPLRKLGKGDRLLGPLNMAKGYGLPYDNLAIGVAAAFLFRFKDDEQSMQLGKKVEDLGIERAVVDVTGLEQGSEEAKKVVDAYHALHARSTNH
ncbi:hypothetical protein EWM64_g9898 [Hericium alpestre]|uniref:Mannitol-1-phosphate 5-dehydrogenase n=1 Tax=Hericium alpestre TaxID=135208 RepID=A0A4Y9ZI62_9AGAM|nr:hypothetical protein EWM64_g9898 [Hericium alpestre]